MSNGTLRVIDDERGFDASGNFASLQNSISFKLLPNPRKNSVDSPDLIVRAIGAEGQQVECGGAWWKTPNEPGERFLSITIDDESFDRPLNFSAFFNREDRGGDGEIVKVYDVVWRRPRKKRAPDASTEATGADK